MADPALREALREASDRVIDVIQEYDAAQAAGALINAMVTMLYNICDGDRDKMERGFAALSRDIINGIRNADPEHTGKPN